MNSEPLAILVIMTLFAAATGAMASRKNRNGFLWGGAALFLGFWPMIVLAFTSFLCPKCKQAVTNQEASGGKCPRCP